jgi:hypothetical protein
MDKPKPNLSAYVYFSSQRRLELGGSAMSFGGLISTIASEWKEMSENEKLPYTTLAEKDKARYDAELYLYNSQNSIENDGSQ